MSVTPSPSVGPGGFSSPSEVDFSGPDPHIEDVDVAPEVSVAPSHLEYNPWNPQSSFQVNRPRPRQPGEPPVNSSPGKIHTGLSSNSWVGPVSSPSSHSISGNSLRSPSRTAFEQDDGGLKKLPKTKKIFIIAGAAGIAFALALIIALVVVFGANKGDSESTETEGNQNIGGTDGQSGDVTQAPPIVIEDPVIIVDAGTWGDWSEYSVCGVTCGGGYSTRTRDCLSGSCVGVNTQSETCNTERCPPSVIYGSWTTWGDWYGCPLSCGGSMQFRTRSCVKQTDEEECVGEDTQSRECNTFDCPDCSKTCASGTLSDDCTHCECGEKLYGRVISGGIQLAGATISPVETPTAVIATTGADGMLNLTNQCQGSDFIIQKEGYISVEISSSNLGTDSVKIIDMATLEPLTIVTHPQDRMRVVGESATLCCESSGNPSATDYEWLRDGNIVATTSGGTSSSYQFTSLTMEDAGYYQCRANTDYGAIVSSEAHINVKESADQFCSATPISKIIELPDGCSFNGNSYFDIGECSPDPCRGGNPDTGSCADDQDNAYCCGPTVYSVVEIPCEDDDEEFTIPINMAKECGCALCPEPQLSVAGLAYGNETVLEQGSIIHNGTVIAQTTVNGTFEFNVDVGTERMSLLFKDTVNKILLDTVYVVDFPKGAEGMYYITVLMLSTAYTETVDSTQETTLELPSVGDDSEPIASVNIPADSFVSADGTPYTGSVDVSVGIVDPEDLTSLEAAPGDFAAVDENGQTIALESSGMLSFSFTDADGNALAVNADVVIEIPTDDEEVVLWEMNPTSGNWEAIGESSPSRKKSTGTTSKLNGIKYQETWYNFDRVRGHPCYSKFQVYGDQFFLENDRVTGVEASVITMRKKKGKKRGTRSLSRLRPYNEKNDRNGYCVVHSCASYRGETQFEFEAWMMAHKDGKRLKPVNYTEFSSGDINGMSPADSTYGITSLRNKYHVANVTLISPNEAGPFYDHDNNQVSLSSRCSSAPLTDKHFRFYANICYREFDVATYTTKAKNQCVDDYWLLWYSLPSLEVPSVLYRVAFIKVSTRGMYDAKVIARSTVWNRRTTSTKGKRNKVIGTRKDCIDNYYQIACMEFKPPSEIGCSMNETVAETEFGLVVRVRGGHKVTALNPNLLTAAGNNIKKGTGKKKLKLVVNDQYIGPDFGLYAAEHTDVNIARRMAKQMCLTGSSVTDGSVDITSDNWAVQFDNCKDTVNIVFAFGLYHPYHFVASTLNHVLTNVKALMEAIPPSTTVRYGLIDSIHEETDHSPVIVPLDSDRSMDSDLLEQFDQLISEEWYEWDYSYYDVFECNRNRSSNNSALHHALQVVEDGPEDAQNILILMGDQFDCDYCTCYPDNEITGLVKTLRKKDVRILQMKSNLNQFSTDALVDDIDEFGFTHSEEMVTRVKEYGCMLDEEDDIDADEEAAPSEVE